MTRAELKSIFHQFCSFLLVSGVGWLIDFSIFTLLSYLTSLPVMVINIVSSTPAITYVFLMSGNKIFKNTESKLSMKLKYLIYFGYQLLLLLLISAFAELLFAWFSNIFTADFILNNLKLIIKILITPITMTLNFIVMKNLIERL